MMTTAQKKVLTIYVVSTALAVLFLWRIHAYETQLEIQRDQWMQEDVKICSREDFTEWESFKCYEHQTEKRLAQEEKNRPWYY